MFIKVALEEERILLFNVLVLFLTVVRDRFLQSRYVGVIAVYHLALELMMQVSNFYCLVRNLHELIAS